GLPPVTADVGGQGEIVTPEVGYLIPHSERSEELTAYVSALRRLIEHREHRRQLSAAARRRIVEHCSVEQMGRRLHEMLMHAQENRLHQPRVQIPARTAAQYAAVSVDRLR